jgi:putative DNA primase/helicase
MTTSPLRGLSALDEHALAEHVAANVARGRWAWSGGFGWMRWDGVKWVRDNDREANALKTDIRYYFADWIARHVLDLTRVELAALHAYTRIGGLDRMERALKTVRGVNVPASRFDADPMTLNTPSGVLDLHTLQLSPHSPDHWCTRLTGAHYDPAATHPDWEQALTALPDPETARWLQAQLGHGAVGRQVGDLVLFLSGGGQNGKSLIMQAVLAALGDYAGTVSDELLSGRTHEEHLMRLRGLRLAVIEELTDGHRLNIARLKQISGTGKVLGRHLYREPVEWAPTHNLVVTTNYQPIVPETDHGTWRRLRNVPFPHTFAKDDPYRDRVAQDPAIQAAVLRWLVDGAVSGPVGEPAAVLAATSGWRMSVDMIAQFLDERCVRDPAGAISKTALLDAFKRFAQSQGGKPLSSRMLTARLREHPVVKEWAVEEHRTETERQWRGLSVKFDATGWGPDS